MCLFIGAASALAIDNAEKKQEKRGVLGVGIPGGVVGSPLIGPGYGYGSGLVGHGLVGSGLVGHGYGYGSGLVGHGLVGPGVLGHGVVGSTVVSPGLGLSHGVLGVPSSLGLAHGPLGLGVAHAPLGVAHAPLGLGLGYGGLGLSHSSLVGSPLGLGLSHGIVSGQTIIH